ncbi:MAG: SDR family oxidoreductase [Proteobacteria bacterium]|nr:SDR family oxidoreductase [Pseudomonadota bacterium]
MGHDSVDAALKDKVVIVTGAGGGIGAASCLVFANAGARLVISDVSEAAAESTFEMIRARGQEARLIPADVASESSIRQLVEQTVAAFGRLDGAFNNAGVSQLNVPLTELTVEQWERCIRIDLTGVFLCIKHQVSAMLKNGGGAIVNTSSGLGQVAIPNAAEYVSAKHGVLGVTRAAAAEFSDRGIRVNAIMPGVIRTPMIDRLSADPRLAEFFLQIKARNFIHRLGESAEVAEAAKWLLSDAASFVTGVAFPVDGGFMAS